MEIPIEGKTHPSMGECEDNMNDRGKKISRFLKVISFLNISLPKAASPLLYFNHF